MSVQGEQWRIGDAEVRIVLLVSGVLLASGAVSACSENADFGDGRTGEGRSFAAAIDAANDNVVSFREVFGEDFEMATVACPFMGPDDVKKALGFNWGAAKNLPLQDDSVNAVVLTRRAKVVHVEVLKRLVIDVCAVGDVGVVNVDPATDLHFVQAENSDGSTGWAAERIDGSD